MLLCAMTQYKFNEAASLEEIREYIDNTYGEHYSNGNLQSMELIDDAGHGTGFCIGNIIKLAQRFGKKDGYNRKDLLKIAHYAILLMNIHHDNQDQEDDAVCPIAAVVPLDHDVKASEIYQEHIKNNQKGNK